MKLCMHVYYIISKMYKCEQQHIRLSHYYFFTPQAR